MLLMEGKAGLVTGAGSGIGRATAIAVANHGATVGVSDYNEESGKETVALINEAGGKAEFFRCDVSEEEQVKALVDLTANTYGTLDFAFNNAGTAGEFAPIGEMDSAVFDRVMKINLYGVFYCMKYEVLAMEASGGGAIVNTSSINGLIGIPRNASYNASKFAVIGITKNVAIDYGAKGIRVNALAPGPTTTPMLTDALERHTPEFRESMYASLPMRDLLKPEDQANAAVWLCSDQARMITGTTLVVDGGRVP
ncbi:glucose 1-dehydrogenase [Rhodococcus sp. 14C212]|uniref:SDR family NAD(P)-dependent oxidoreductase n=1 Tax=Rhodococcus sp. 14C212 TaxID=2711209 RepID=UPI0013EA8CEA|nr:glucose 1-dehydrogenase [Rhodococcus sp. 14C212]NGP06736.1 glucose 1-dehydrogenase [Rhodococcus sp. 14C212]